MIPNDERVVGAFLLIDLDVGSLVREDALERGVTLQKVIPTRVEDWGNAFLRNVDVVGI